MGVVEHHCRHHCLVVVGEEEDHLDRLQRVHPHLVVVVVVVGEEEEEVLLKYDLYIYYKSKATLRSYIGQKVNKIENIRTLTFGNSVEKYYHDKRKENCTRCHVAQFYKEDSCTEPIKSLEDIKNI